MPELPEVEQVRRSLEPVLVGLRVADASLARSDITQQLDEQGNLIASRRAREGARSLTLAARSLMVGLVITSLLRKGKQLFIVAGEREPALGVHLGMSGQLYFVPVGAASPVKPFASGVSHVHARWQLCTHDGTPAGELLFRDPRRFGALTLAPHHAALHAWLDASLGPDALTITGEHLLAKVRRSSRSIKAALLDQSIVAGVGNIYADEALFRSRLAPQLRCAKLGAEGADALAGHLRALLAQAVEAGGSTLRDYVDGLGNTGSAQLLHQVYGRAGKPCTTCGKPLRTATIAQRTTVWCEQCQRAGTPKHSRTARQKP